MENMTSEIVQSETELPSESDEPPISLSEDARTLLDAMCSCEGLTHELRKIKNDQLITIATRVGIEKTLNATNEIEMHFNGSISPFIKKKIAGLRTRINGERRILEHTSS